MYIGIDLGSTNIKAALYDRDMRLIDRSSCPVEYLRPQGFVEFDAEVYFEGLIELLRELLSANSVTEVTELSFTGQAESLVVLGADGRPLMNAISWMDERSVKECEELSRLFPPALCEAVTGQMAVLPTWPATKILWLRHERPGIYAAAKTYMLLKDYIIYRLTSRKMADMSIATFSFYFDIYEKRYWKEMLGAIGVREDQLPPLTEPRTFAGELLPEFPQRLQIRPGTRVNVGTLDHFAGMIGTGNIRPGSITLSTGTVMAMATLCPEPAPRSCGLAMHYGFLPDSYVQLPVAESGGVSLEWFHRNCCPQLSLREIDEAAEARGMSQLIFLPYIVGTNAPEFDTNATGVFWGLRQEHDAVDMARAVMEGVAFVLRKNCECLRGKGCAPESIIATGGGAKSRLWCQMQADITGLPVRIPAEKEAACLGAALCAATDAGRFPDLAAASAACVSFREEYLPRVNEAYERKYRRFVKLYDACLGV